MYWSERAAHLARGGAQAQAGRVLSAAVVGVDWELLWAGQSISAVVWTRSGPCPEQEPMNAFEGGKEETWINGHIDMNEFTYQTEGLRKAHPKGLFQLEKI